MTGWEEPDDGIWEVRGPRRHFTHSKVMAWVAFDRAVRWSRNAASRGPVDDGASCATRIHEEVCAEGYNTKVGAFTQYYGSDALDASLLMIPLVGFLPATDERVRSTIEAIERDLTEDGFVLRYRTEDARRRGRAGRSGGGLPGLLVLDGRLPPSHRPPRRRPSPCFDRLVGLSQRPRAAGRGVRRPGRAPGRELPPGLLPRVARQRRLQPVGPSRRWTPTRDIQTGAPAQRRWRHGCTSAQWRRGRSDETAGGAADPTIDQEEAGADEGADGATADGGLGPSRRRRRTAPLRRSRAGGDAGRRGVRHRHRDRVGRLRVGAAGSRPPRARPRVARPCPRSTGRMPRWRPATSWWASSAVPTRCPAPTAPWGNGTSVATASTPSAASRATTATARSATGSIPTSR